MRLILCAATAALLCGCAMTPEQQDAFRQNFNNGLAAQQQQRVYQQQQPAYQAPRMQTTNCTRTFNGGMNCTTW